MSDTEIKFTQAQFEEAAASLCDIGKILYDRDWSPATSSNYSVRLSPSACALTSSGRHKGELKPDQILAVDLDGHNLNWSGTSGKPSAETGLHTQLYRRDAKIGAVLHTHSPRAVLLSQLWPDTALSIQGWELQKAFAGETTHEDTLRFPIFANDQNIDRLAEQVEHDMRQHGQGHAYLIKGHGIYTWGTTLTECFRHLEALEHLLGYQLELLKLGKSS